MRAAVLDGATDPSSDFLTSGLQQSAGFEKSINKFLQRCSAEKACLLYNGGKAEKAFDDLMLSIDNTPIASRPGRPKVTRGVALTAVAEAMYSETSWPDLEVALADAAAGHEPSGAGRGARPSNVLADVRDALGGLGYDLDEIRDVLGRLPAEGDAADLVRQALKLLAVRV